MEYKIWIPTYYKGVFMNNNNNSVTSFDAKLGTDAFIESTDEGALFQPNSSARD